MSRDVGSAHSEIWGEGPPEQPDIETSSEEYARRFAGGVGRWFLKTQESAALELMAPGLRAGSRVLEVGGGHAQLTPGFLRVGYQVVVLGSAPAAASRVRRLEEGSIHFDVGRLTSVPYKDRSFDAVACFRVLPHVRQWRAVIAEICRVSRKVVVVDYPSSRSFNMVAGNLFGLKKALEHDTRAYALFTEDEINEAFEGNGYRVTGIRPQFFWPMALHRAHRVSAMARALEWPPRALGLTARWGSPVVLRAERRQ